MHVFKSESLLLIFCIKVISLIHSTTPVRDMRYVSYEDIHMDSATMMFHHASVTSFLHPLFHPSLPHIILATKNHLIRLHTTNLTSIEVVTWLPDLEHKNMCTNRRLPPEDCENFIKLLVLQDGGDVIACGTYAHSPMCSWRNASSLSTVIKEDKGLGRCPYNRHSNISFLLSSSGDLYTALSLDAAGIDPAIVRTSGPSLPLRTDKSNSFWLDRPEFVGMFESEEYVYIFFREVAVEQISCGKLIVSRVARICKSDRGGTSWILKNNWTTFSKATLNCSRPGEYPFYYNEIQDVHYDKDTQVFTALFTTSPNGLYGSAVCEYSAEEIEEVMAGNFKQYHTEQKTWKSAPSQHGKECPRENPDTNDKDPSLRHLRTIAASQHQLADNAVQPLQIHPVIERPNERYNKLEVEVLEGRYRNKTCALKLVYMSSIEGLINKFVLVPHNHTTKHHHHHHHKRIHHHHHHPPHHHPPKGESERSSCLVESIQLLPPDLPQPINFLKINPANRQLVAGTEERLYQIPTSRCHKFLSKSSCGGAQDPHCGWKNSKCQRTTTHSISSCPITHLIGKMWYGESDWSDCSVTCGEGVQMRVQICLDNMSHLPHTNHFKNSPHCPGSTHFTRPCKLRACPDHSMSPWSPWLVNDSNEERYRCSCESGNGKHGCKARLQRSERVCKNQAKCAMRLKRLVSRNIQKHTSGNNQRYNHFSNPAHSSKYSFKKHSQKRNTTLNKPTDTILKRNDLKYTNLRKNPPTKHTVVKIQQDFQPAKNLIKEPVLSNDLGSTKKTKPVDEASKSTPCPSTCLHQMPPHMGIFYGFCGCRDMGVFRVCHKCSGNP